MLSGPRIHDVKKENSNPEVVLIPFELEEYYTPPPENTPINLYTEIPAPPDKQKSDQTSHPFSLASLLANFSFFSAPIETPHESAPIDRSSHAVIPVNKTKQQIQNEQKPSTHLFKKVDSPNMCILEATGSAFLRLIAPEHAAISKAVFDDQGHYTGVITKRISGFISLRHQPLQKSHLKIGILDRDEITLTDLIKLNHRIRQDISELDDNAIIQGEITSTDSDGNPCLKTISISVQDLRNTRINRGLGIGISASYAHEEGDLHSNNINLMGVRIDFDELCTKVFSYYKDRNFLARQIDPRIPTHDTLKVTCNNILHFPNLLDGTPPAYWPTIARGYMGHLIDALNQAHSELARTTQLITDAPPLSQNGFLPEESAVFQQIATNKVFKFYKYKTFLHFLLTSSNHYRNLARLHIPETTPARKTEHLDTPEKMIKEIVQNRVERIKQFETVLIRLPKFYRFLKKYGALAMDEIEKDFKRHNAYYGKKERKHNQTPEQQNAYQKVQIDIEKIHTKYQEIYQKTHEYIEQQPERPPQKKLSIDDFMLVKPEPPKPTAAPGSPVMLK